ncbi:MAG: 2-dehydropantoate 2-reductase N-terminal domain-containing protein [Myxococcota bacterium]|nr:2-dehydropantoate 2-reductase N-terminal domain-containing protein [Myxococcota bacterium]
MMMASRVLIVGCGGIGGVLTASAARAPFDSWTVSRNDAVRDRIAKNGLICIRGRTRQRSKPRVVDTVESMTFDLVVLATQPTDVESAARQYGPHLSDDGEMLVLQNGLCEERVARVLESPERVVGGVVAWGARTHGVGVVEQTSEGHVIIGTLTGRRPRQMSLINELFNPIATVKWTDNLLGSRWSKLILNCIVSSLGTLNGTHLGAVVRALNGRRLGLKILAEGVAAADALGIVLEPVSGTIDLRQLSLAGSTPRGSRWRVIYAHGILLVVGFKYRKLYSSLLRAIEAGRPPAVDFLNGELVRAGRSVGLPMVVNAAICDKVHGFARGQIEPGPQTIDRLLETVSSVDNEVP